MIHCDLRPKNFLVDEYGILKLADFKMTQKIPKELLQNKALELRGSPPYMAPGSTVPPVFQFLLPFTNTFTKVLNINLYYHYHHYLYYYYYHH